MFSQSSKQGIRNPWVLGFAAIVLSGVLVNVYLVWNVMHNPVRLLDDAYSVNNHNKAEAKWVQQQAARNALGWQARLHFPQQIQGGDQQKHEAHIVLADNPAKIRLELSDREGKSVLGGQVAITAQWPGNASHDFSVALHEVAQGQYENSMSFPKAGNWDLHIKAQQGGHLFEMEQRVFVAKSQ